MKAYFFNSQGFWAFVLVFLFIGLLPVKAQEITEQDKKEQEEVLKQDPKNYAALFVVGAYYYNQAIEPHVKASNMPVTEYLEKGEALEKQKSDYLLKALPYFENAYTVAEGSEKERMKEILKGIYQQLGVIPSARVTPGEISSLLNEKLSAIQFKEIAVNE